MRIKSIVWDEVEITCPEDPSKNHCLKEASVTCQGTMVTITAKTSSFRSLSYAMPEVLSLTPWSAEIKALWFSSKGSSFPVMIVCKFDMEI